MNHEFRLFIDSQILKKSYSSDYDETYEAGPLTMDISDYLKVNVIEIWGFPNLETFEQFEKFKARKLKIKYSSSQSTKKILFGGGFNQDMFLPNLTKHKKDVRLDMEYEKKKRDEEYEKYKKEQNEKSFESED